MEMYRIKIELLTETLFGNGEAIPGYVDIQTDESGFPFLKAKTLKGLIRENVELICNNLNLDNKLVTHLFGDTENAGILRFADATLSNEVKSVLNSFFSKVSEKQDMKIEKEDIKRAITTQYTFTRIENGIAADHYLRTVRMLNKGMIFYAEVTSQIELSDIEKNLFGCGTGLLKHVGTLKSKGKGYVNTELLLGDKKITSSCFENLGRMEVTQ